MTAVRLALLNAAEDHQNTARNFRRELDADLVEFTVQAGQLPTTFDFDGCVVTGSRASVYWDEDWIQPLKTWVGEAIERGLPFLGVCFGHQLLADVLGGTVEDMGEYEIGYRDIHHSGDDPLFAEIGSDFMAFTTHSDRVIELPPGATQIAWNDYGVHGFRKDNVVAVQFHPEYDMETARVVTGAKDELAADKKSAVLDGITEDHYRRACEAKILFDNFISIIADGRTPAPTAD